ncbi:MAG: hypothetical protein CVV27_16980 [Candidatus Melainabacteria bacterium HGW-Melainabacteria-1]|nr:MAG: hypothetical protein CVV27_16980 [Candidatus Melainabacteria bacterium HGW-Melainabacteria-1]
MKKHLTEAEIDALVIQEADQEDAWEFEAEVKQPKAISLRLDTHTIEQLKLLSQLHGEKGYQSLIKRWISEHVQHEIGMLKEVQANLDTLNWETLTK